MNDITQARAVAALEKIADHWGDPMPIGTGYKVLMRKWMFDYRTLQNIAREALGKPLFVLPEVEA